MPYIIITKTPPTTGAMACCRSYISAGKCGHMLEQSRRAVATPEEARDGATALVDAALESVRDVGGWEVYDDAARNLPENGGIIGPLPDGTVIKVDQQADDFDVAAFNAQQGG